SPRCLVLLVLLVVGWWLVDSGFLTHETKLVVFQAADAIREQRSAGRIRMAKVDKQRTVDRAGATVDLLVPAYTSRPRDNVPPSVSLARQGCSR
ncbi:MAG: hypothetical protein M3092_01530, partial [Actinomycetia bacterium]|nr:hypothetical protein [Actinomycetes bacterium]